MLKSTTISRMFFLSNLLIMLFFLVYSAYFLVSGEYNKFRRNLENVERNYSEMKKLSAKLSIDSIYEDIQYERSLIESRIITVCKERAYLIRSVISGIYESNKEKKEEEIIQIIIKTIENLRQEKDLHYFYLIDMKGVSIFNLEDPEMDGLNLYGVQDVKGNFFIREILEKVKKENESPHKYFWKKSKDNNPKGYGKIVYAVSFKPLNLVVVAAEYKEDHEKELKNFFIDQIMKSGNNETQPFMVSSETGLPLNKIPDMTNEMEAMQLMSALSKVSPEEKNIYIKYRALNKETGKRGMRVSYIKEIPEWKIIIGDGFFMADATKAIEEHRLNLIFEVREKILYIVILFLAGLLIMLFASNQFSGMIEKEFNVFKKFFQGGAARYEKIDKDKLSIIEFMLLANAANMMIDNLVKSQFALKETEDRHKALFEASNDAICILYDNLIIDSNSQTAKMFSVDKKKLLGMSFLDLPMPESDNINTIKKQIKEKINLASIGKPQFMVCKYQNNMDVFETEIHFTGMNNTGTPFIFAVIRDITERRKFENKLQQTQKLESLGVLAGGIAHDFNNLLMGILGNASLAQLDTPSDSKLRKYLEAIEKTSCRAADLCNQMLAYSGKGKFLVQQIHLSALVEEMYNLLKVSISKKAFLKTKIDPDIPMIEGDQTQIRQIIMNLIINASEALDGKDGTISITTASMNCDREFLKDCIMGDEIEDGDFSYVEVSDTGCGMSKETIERIFDPFFTTKFTGRGLGLAAVLGIVRGHKGVIKIYSEVGNGTSFRILFPSVAKEEPPVISDDAELKELKKEYSGTVLIIDDDENVRNIAGTMLESFGYTVLQAEDGYKGLDILREKMNEIGLILLDITMPQMDGEEAFREIKKITTNIPVLLTSGYNEDDVAIRFHEKGVAGFIQKPYTVKNLLLRVNDILNN